MKIEKIVSRLACVVLIIQSLSSLGVTVFATEESIDSHFQTDITETLSSETMKTLDSASLDFQEESNDLDHSVVEEYSNNSSNQATTEYSKESDQITDVSEEEQVIKRIAEGVHGTVSWYITTEGTLVLEGGVLPEVEKGTNNLSPWISYLDTIKRIDIVEIITSTGFGAEALFSGLTNLKNVNNLERLDINRSYSIRNIFNGTAIQKIDVSNWDLSNVEDLSCAFKGVNLNELDLSNWSILKGANLDGIFEDAKIGILNLSGWGISEVDWKNLGDVTVDKVIGLEVIVEADLNGDNSSPAESVEEIQDEPKNTRTAKELNLYGAIVDKNYRIFSDKELKEDISDKYSLMNKTIHITESIITEKGEEYYLISDNSGLIGYIQKTSIQFASGEQGLFNKLNRYVTIIGTSPIWNDFTWEKSHSPNRYKNKTFKAQGIYYHFNGSVYLSLYDAKNNWIGYINENGTRSAKAEQGIFNSLNRYVTVIDGPTIWDSFDWSKKTDITIYKNQTLKAKGIYYHFNGSVYLSLYDAKNNWMGYINEKETKKAQGEQGIFHSYDKYVVMTGTHDVWDGFEWKNKKNGSEYKNQTFKASGIYYHFNGYRYLSLYNSKGTWIGYVNESGTKITSGAQGGYHPYSKYVHIKGSYDIWSGFDWINKTSKTKYKNKILEAKGIYYHFDGSRYLSLYDNKGRWIGYMNESGAKVTKDKQGPHYSYNQLVKISAKNPTIWKNFNFKDKVSGNHKNKIYVAKGYYDHFNGSRYLSLYNKGKWVGYTNESNTSKVRGAASYFQTTRKKFVDSLNRNKKIYLKTPYKGLATAPYQPERLMSPIGRPNGHPPAFNCTGFVARAVRDGGGNLNKVTSVANAWGGINNAYNWRDTLVSRTDSISFKTISELLKSGLAKKGDIIYLEADFSKPGYDCHIGIFWGDTPNDNKFWNSTVAGGGNNITNIFSGTPYSKAILIPMD